MPKFFYRAINENGKIVKNNVTTRNVEELEGFLKEKKCELISYKVESNLVFNKFFSKLSDKELITIFTHLYQLNKAGVSILDTIEDVRDAASSKKVESLMQDIYDSIKNGSLMSEAFGKHSNIFSPIFIGLISTGERTGNLEVTFYNIIHNLKWNLDIKKKAMKAIRYPLFSLLVILGVVWAMTTVVVPKVTKFLLDQDIPLSFLTTSLIAFSDFMVSKGLLVLLTPIILFVIYKFLRRINELKIIFDRVKLKLPIFGGIITKLDASRFCHFFSITFSSGLGVLECLKVSRDVVGNEYFRFCINRIITEVSDGTSLSKAIGNSPLFPQLVFRMFKIGEESGNMDEALENIQYFYNTEVNDSIDKVIGAIQPSLVFIMGGLIVWILVAVFAPVYSSFSQI